MGFKKTMTVETKCPDCGHSVSLDEYDEHRRKCSKKLKSKGL